MKREQKRIQKLMVGKVYDILIAANFYSMKYFDDLGEKSHLYKMLPWEVRMLSRKIVTAINGANQNGENNQQGNV